MSEDLARLIENVSACSKSLKGTVDQYVSALVSMREASLRCDAELSAKQEHANAEINRLRSDIAGLRQEHAQVERQLQDLRGEIDKERRMIGREKAKFRDELDQIVLAR
jgi:septal ring factor EnvC (AmiA/AmiB activator)